MRKLALVRLWGEFIFLDPTDFITFVEFDDEVKKWKVVLVDLRDMRKYFVGYFNTKEEANHFSDFLYDTIFFLAFSDSSLPYLDIHKVREEFEKTGFLYNKEILFEEDVL